MLTKPIVQKIFFLLLAAFLLRWAIESGTRRLVRNLYNGEPVFGIKEEKGRALFYNRKNRNRSVNPILEKYGIKRKDERSVNPILEKYGIKRKDERSVNPILEKYGVKND